MRCGRAGRARFRIATWNLGSLNGRDREVVEELRRRNVDICCLQETRHPGEGSKMLGNTGSRYKLLWTGHNRIAKEVASGGVGILMAEDLADCIQNVKR